MDDLLQRVRRCEALQQPEWGDPSRLRDVQAYLRGSPALIRAGDILALRATLARVARGEALVVQCGDCAEDMDDHHAENVARKAGTTTMPRTWRARPPCWKWTIYCNAYGAAKRCSNPNGAIRRACATCRRTCAAVRR
ncbi:hypothetical protein IPC1494_21485 [Pseudomonas aeruginosa]|nr:hypothetical protein IPC1494_21485 [Pseudomonas aeruginosa]